MLTLRDFGLNVTERVRLCASARSGFAAPQSFDGSRRPSSARLRSVISIDGAHQLNDISRLIQDRVPDRLNMFDRSAGQHDPELTRGIYFFAERLLKASLHAVPILRVDKSESRFPGR